MGTIYYTAHYILDKTSDQIRNSICPFNMMTTYYAPPRGHYAMMLSDVCLSVAIHAIRYMDYGVKADWGVVRLAA